MSVAGLTKGGSTAASEAGDKDAHGLGVDRSGNSTRGKLRFADEIGDTGLPSPSKAAPQAPPQPQRTSPAHSSLNAASMRISLINLNDSGSPKGNSADDPHNIWEAAERGSTGYIVRLVERNVEFNVNQKDKLLRTALHWAAECNHKDTVECLLDYNADVTATECNGRTAIHLAARAGLPDILSTLLDPLGQELREQLSNQPDLYGITPVYMAIQKGDEGRAAFNVLVENGGRYNQTCSTQTAGVLLRNPVSTQGAQ